MGRIAQIDKIITEGRLFAKNCTQIFKLEAIKFRLQKVIAAKREKANNSRLLEQELEGHFRKYQSMKLIEAHAGPAVEWTRKGSSVQWIRGQSPCKEWFIMFSSNKVGAILIKLSSKMYLQVFFSRNTINHSRTKPAINSLAKWCSCVLWTYQKCRKNDYLNVTLNGDELCGHFLQV